MMRPSASTAAMPNGADWKKREKRGCGAGQRELVALVLVLDALDHGDRDALGARASTSNVAGQRRPFSQIEVEIDAVGGCSPASAAAR